MQVTFKTIGSKDDGEGSENAGYSLSRVGLMSRRIRELQSELEWAQGLRFKAVSKDLEVAVKVRELRRGREEAGDV